MRNGARTASTRAISYFAFRCYSEIVANRPAWNRWPVRCFLPHLSRFFPVLLLVPPLPSTQPLLALEAPNVLVPAASYPTRCFINENEGASYIFLTQSRPAPSFFLSIMDLFLPTLLLPFSPTFSPPGWRIPTQPAAFSAPLTVRRHFHYCSRQ